MTVTVAQVATAVGRSLTATEKEQAAMWIADAAVLISHGPDGRSTIDVATLDQGTLDLVIREAVADRIKQPDAVSEVTVAVDDASTSRKYVAASGQLRIRDEWWAMLLPDEGGDAGSTRLAYEPGHPLHHQRPGHHHHLYPSFADPSSYAG